MIDDRLNIPLKESPIPQKFWGIVRFVAPFLLLGMIGAVGFRLFLVKDSLTKAWPEGATSAVRILKTRSSAEILENALGGVMTDESRQRIASTITESKRESVIFMNADGIIAVANDRENRAFTWPRFNLRLLAPWYNGELLVKDGEDVKALPIRINEDGATIHGTRHATTSSVINFDEDTQISTRLTVPKELTASLVPANIPLVYPGTRALAREIETNGVFLIFGEDQDGFSYALSIENGQMTDEEITSFVKESLLFPSVTTLEVENPDGTLNFTELRSNKDVTVTNTEDGSFALTTGKSRDGEVVRVTKTPGSVIISNRAIALSSEKVRKDDVCLKSASEFILPEKLAGLLPTPITINALTGSSFFTNVSEISFSKNRTRICW